MTIQINGFGNGGYTAEDIENYLKTLKMSKKDKAKVRKALQKALQGKSENTGKPKATASKPFQVNPEIEKKVLAGLDREFGQPKNPLLKGITYGQTQPLVYQNPELKLPQMTYKDFEEVVKEDLSTKFGNKNSLLESIKPNQDFRGKNFIGEQLTEAQKLLEQGTKHVEQGASKSASKLAKYGKWGAAIAGVLAVATGTFALLWTCDKSTPASDNPLNKKPVIKPAAKSEQIEPKPVTEKPADDTTSQKTEEKPVVQTEQPVQTEQVKPAEQQQQAYIPLLKLDDDGSYTTKKNDNFWRIAEKHLKDKFKAQGIDRKPTNAEIQKETDRIIAANNYKYNSNHWLTSPILQPNVKLVIEEKLDKAA